MSAVAPSYSSVYTFTSPQERTHQLIVLDFLDPRAQCFLIDKPLAAVVADPPYSSGAASTSGRTASPVKKYAHDNGKGKLSARYLDWHGDQRDQRSWTLWSSLWLSQCQRIANPETYVFSFCDWRQLPALTDAVQMAGWVWRGVGVWDKGAGVRACHHAYLRSQAEYAVWGTAGPLKARYDRKAITAGVLTCSPDAPSKRIHLCQKPVDVLRWLLSVVETPGFVLDPFSGSGSSILAADAEGRECVAFEVVPGIAQQAIDRLESEGSRSCADSRLSSNFVHLRYTPSAKIRF